MKNFLHCFISHKSVISEDIDRISLECDNLNIKDYLIICGGSDLTIVRNNFLNLRCLDSYEGLSDKIHKLFKFLIQEYPIKYDHYVKIDRLAKILKPIDDTVITGDYCGSWVRVKQGFDGDRWWHKNKCSKESEWNNKPYSGKFIPWCRGGSGYILSYKAAEIISCNPPDLKYHIYEDLYVAETLLTHEIIAKQAYKLKEYIVDPDEGKLH